MPRLRLLDFAKSSGPAAVGICSGDTDAVAALAFECEERLITCVEAGEAGWWGSWAEMIFSVSREDPYVTTPFNVARIESLAVCRRPIQIQNQFFETMQYGIGPQRPDRNCRQQPQVYQRNDTPTFSDIVPPGKSVRVFTSASDAGKRTLIGCLDANGDIVYSQDGINNVTGIYVEFAAPFAQVPFEISKVTSIQKDATNDPVHFYEVDLSSGALRLILTMQPEETTANYHRFYFAGLPRNCCPDTNNPSTNVTVTGIVKFELIKATTLSDWLLIQSLQALIEEAQSIRQSRMDNSEAAQLSINHHKNAIRYLNGQLVHYLGKQKPAIEFLPFGSARLERQCIGTLL